MKKKERVGGGGEGRQENGDVVRGPRNSYGTEEGGFNMDGPRAMNSTLHRMVTRKAAHDAIVMMSIIWERTSFTRVPVW